MASFVEYVGLGFNCEVAYEIRRAGQSRAHFFDWASTPLLSLTEMIEARLEGARETISDDIDGMIRDDVFFHRFHGPHSAEKVAHLRRRFLHPLGKRCYVLKIDYAFPADVVRLMDALDDISPDYALVVVCEPSFHEKTVHHATFNLQIDDRVFLRPLKRFAPLEDASDSHRVSWEAIWSEFSLGRAETARTVLHADPMTVDLAA